MTLSEACAGQSARLDFLTPNVALLFSPTKDALARARPNLQRERDVWDEPLPSEEFERLVRLAIAELDGPEGETMKSFMAWFKRRYPTPLERLRFSTHQYRKWMRSRGILTNPR